jgi:hypothetical protein
MLALTLQQNTLLLEAVELEPKDTVVVVVLVVLLVALFLFLHKVIMFPLVLEDQLLHKLSCHQ